MYVAKILLPENQTINGNSIKLKPDRVLIESIFTYLHTEQHKVDKDYKFVIDFPKYEHDNIGNQLNIFSKNKEDLIKHIKADKLYRLITDNCVIKIDEVKITAETKFRSLKIKKESSGLGLSKIRRLIKRGQGEVFNMHKERLTLKEISDSLAKNDEKKPSTQFIRYNSRNSANKAYFYINRTKAQSKDDILDFSKANSFGFGNIKIPSIEF